MTFERSEQLVLYRKGNSFMICSCGLKFPLLILVHLQFFLKVFFKEVFLSQPRVKSSHKYLKMDTIIIEGIKNNKGTISYSKYFCLHACTHIHMQMHLTVWRPEVDNKMACLIAFSFHFFKLGFLTELGAHSLARVAGQQG